MKPTSNVTKKVVLGIALMMLAGLLGLATALADQPLSKEDLTLLLLGNSPSDKIIQMVEQRGIDFQMDPGLAKKFHDLGASDGLIDTLQKAGNRVAAATSRAPAPAPESKPNAPAAPAAASAASAPAAAEAKPAAAAPTTASAPGLKDPSPEEIQHIIREFAAKEKIFREARNNYAYHQINKVQELGTDNEVVGTFEQEWDILYDDSGKRIERVTYAPTPTLKGLIVTQEDIENFRNIQPFVLTTDELPEYEVKYLGHVKVDEITAYVFSVRPKEIQKNRLYFQGVVWVDDRDLQIVKSEGKTVPELKGKKGQNLFPRFTTWREQIDGKFWFPTYTLADDTLYFPNGPPVHMKEIVRYTDYKQFKSGVRILTVESIDKQKEPTTPPPAAPHK